MPKRKRQDCVDIEFDGPVNNPEEGVLVNCPPVEEDAIQSKIGGQTDDNSVDDEANGCIKSRRKSKRVVKPRALDANLSPNLIISSLKKIVNKNGQNLTSVVSEQEKQSSKPKTDEVPKGKSSRKWEMWTEDDTKWFFEALCENGKDFPKIQLYMAQRSEKKGIPQELIKNKEQVRHYYYRTWHKIANNLKIANSNVIDKGTQEIYGLINYGEIWKKFGSKFDNKLGHHLQELVHFGHTIFKVKGKSIRIKTPICKALKKLHNFETSDKSKSGDSTLVNLPKEICVELHPATNQEWLRVHSMAQNPRVRTRLPLQKRLSVLIEYLENRWNPARIKDIECNSLCGTSLPKNNDNLCFRIRPQNVDNLNTVLLNQTYLINSQMDLSLGSYLNRLFYNDEFKESKKKRSNAKGKDKLNEDKNDKIMKSPDQGNDTKNSLEDVNDDEKLLSEKSENEQNKSDEDEEPNSEAERSLFLLKMLASMNDSQNEIEEGQATDEDEDETNKEDLNKEEVDKEDERDDDRDEIPSDLAEGNQVSLLEPPSNATISQWLSAKEQTEGDGAEDEDAKANQQSQSSEIINEMSEETGEQTFQVNADRAKKGWSLEDVGSMTVGELYLLLRCPEKIVLEYFWEPKNNEDQNTTGESVNNETSDNCNNSNEKETQKGEKHKAQSILAKLLLAANLSLMNMKGSPNNVTSMQQNFKKRRIKPTRVDTSSTGLIASNSSQLLSSVISNTIFNTDNHENKVIAPAKGLEKPNNDNEKHKFVVPTSPAPKVMNKSKGRTICGDAAIQEALKQLQSNKYTRRQRRPTPKPVFSQQKPLLPRVAATTTSTSSLSRPIYIIPSQPLHLNVVSQQSKTPPMPVLNQTIPVVTNINLTPLNANLQNANETKKNANESIGTILLQQQRPIVVTQTSCVNSLMKSAVTSNINPLIQNAAQLIGTVNSCPILTSTMSSLQPFPSAQKLLPTEIAATSEQLTSIDNSKSLTIQPSSSNNIVINDAKQLSLHSQTANLISSTTSLISATSNNHQAIDKNDHKPIHSIVSSEERKGLSTPPLTTRSVESPPLISALLEISLPEPPPVFSEHSCANLPDSESLNTRPFGSLNSPEQPSVNPTLPPASGTSATLPSASYDRLKPRSPVHEAQWLNGESSDISIGTLLNVYESQCKTAPHLTNDVDTQMSCLVNDNSVDLMAKFADLAAEIVDSNSKST